MSNKLTKLEKKNLKNETEELTISKIDTLLNLLESSRLDEEKESIGSDHKYQLTFNDLQTRRIKIKIMQLIDQL